NRNPYPFSSSRLILSFDSIFHIPPRLDTTREKASDHEYILLPFMPSNEVPDDKDVDEVLGKGDEEIEILTIFLLQDSFSASIRFSIFRLVWTQPGSLQSGFLVGYSVNSKAFRVFNFRTWKIEENLHIRFLENKSNVSGRGPKWLFDTDSLTKSMNYKPVTAGNQTNTDADIEINVNAGQAGQEKASDHEYIMLPFMPSNEVPDDKDVDEVLGKGDEGVSKGSGIDDQERIDSNTQDVNTAMPSIDTTNTNVNISSLNINIIGSNDPSMPSLEETGIFDDVYNDKEVGAEADMDNLELSIIFSPIPITRVHKDHPKSRSLET
nr:hypothetical protein [Tanacetum cinerariifolium]